MQTQILTTILQVFERLSDGAFPNLLPDAMLLISTLAGISIITSALFSYFLGGEDPLATFLFHVLRIGFFVYVIRNLKSLTLAIRDSAIDWGLAAGGHMIDRSTFLDPSALLRHGLAVSAGLFDYIGESRGVVETANSLGLIIFVTIAAFLSFAGFFLLALSVLLALIEFHLVAPLATVLLPWGVLSYSAFLAEMTFRWIAGTFVRLLILSFIVSVTESVLDELALSGSPTIEGALTLIVGSFTLAVIALSVPSIVSGFIVGGSSLGASSYVGAAFGAGIIGRTAFRAVGTTARVVGQSVQGMRTLARNRGA